MDGGERDEGMERWMNGWRRSRRRLCYPWHLVAVDTLEQNQREHLHSVLSVSCLRSLARIGAHPIRGRGSLGGGEGGEGGFLPLPGEGRHS